LTVVGLGGVGPNFDRAREISRRAPLAERGDRPGPAGSTTNNTVVVRRTVMIGPLVGPSLLG
jgi:hypothetical protein